MRGSRAVWILGLMVCAFLSCPSVSHAAELSGKPIGPIHLLFLTESPVSPDAVIPIRLVVTARTDSPNLEVWIELPEGLLHRQGPLHWTGPVKKDQPMTLAIEVGPIGARSYKIVGRAALTLPSGASVTQAASIQLSSETQEKPQPRLRKDSQDQPILEIPVPQ